jgi:hypothetical protein
MPQKIDYKCTKCGREVGRDNLRIKRAVFKDPGVNGSTVKTRVSEWLCLIAQEDGTPSCLDLDPDWNAPKWIGTPHTIGTRMEKLQPGMPDEEEVTNG